MYRGSALAEMGGQGSRPGLLCFRARRSAGWLSPAFGRDSLSATGAFIVFFCSLIFALLAIRNVFLVQECRRTGGEYLGGGVGEAAALLHSDWVVLPSVYRRGPWTGLYDVIIRGCERL